jgi:hypothetical protein
MDRIALEILARELQADGKVIADAAAKARERFEAAWPGHLEAAAFELHRLYNVAEKAFERVCEAFENHFEKRGDYHERLLERMALELPGIRPALLDRTTRVAWRDLKAFRHLFRHAYDIELDPDRMRPLIGRAGELAAAWPGRIEEFAGIVSQALESD